MAERADTSMGYSSTEPCQGCGKADEVQRWKVVGRGLNGWYHPVCMWEALEARSSAAKARLARWRQRAADRASEARWRDDVRQAWEPK